MFFFVILRHGSWHELDTTRRLSSAGSLKSILLTTFEWHFLDQLERMIPIYIYIYIYILIYIYYFRYRIRTKNYKSCITIFLLLFMHYSQLTCSVYCANVWESMKILNYYIVRLIILMMSLEKNINDHLYFLLIKLWISR